MPNKHEFYNVVTSSLTFFYLSLLRLSVLICMSCAHLLSLLELKIVDSVFIFLSYFYFIFFIFGLRVRVTV